MITQNERKKIVLIGSGFSSLAASCYLAKEGFEVVVVEKNNTLGGRARQLKKDGFTFDMGPSFYWMPDVFESFFNDFGTTVSEHYHLEKRNPAYQVYFGKENHISIPNNLEETIQVFEKIETGSGKKLASFIKKAEKNYNLVIKDLVLKPGNNLFEILTPKTLRKIHLFFTDIKSQVARCVKNESLRKVLEFPVLFLGGTSSDTPAFYNFMNYADFGLGTFFPKGGIYSVVQAMVTVAKKLGVTFKVDVEVERFLLEGKEVKALKTSKGVFFADVFLSGADYVHTETLLPKKYRQYSEKYWEKKVFAPSALLFFVGFGKKLKNVSHHTLFFDTDFEKHADAIYKLKKWAEEPLFYASFPSITDIDSAPNGKESGVFLIPLAPGAEDSSSLRKKYFKDIMKRLEALTNQKVQDSILFSESYCVKDFKEDYNAYKGNAYGLANTLFQTHIFRPKLKSKKVKNLYFTGQITVPGPGVPPSIISGKIVSQLITKAYEKTF